jgi:hypothetical protein
MTRGDWRHQGDADPGEAIASVVIGEESKAGHQEIIDATVGLTKPRGSPFGYVLPR